MSAVRCVVRLSGSTNAKSRPSWFSKHLALQSLLEAAAALRVDGTTVSTHVLLDTTGTDPDPALTALLGQVDQVVPVVGGSARRSWVAMLDWLAAADRAWSPDDLVYLVEDDHVHRRDALLLLHAGTADYRLLHCLPHEHDPSGRGRPYQGWRPVDGGVSSFGATVSTLRRDRRTLRTWSWGAGAWDELTWRVLGADRRPPRGYLRAPLAPGSSYRTGEWWWGAWHTAARAAAVATAAVRRRPRSIEAHFPNPVAHAEADRLPPGTDWARLAAGLAGGTEGATGAAR